MKKSLIWFILVLAVLYGALAYRLVKIRPLIRPEETGARKINQEGYFDYRGVIHFHTGYSGDATGSFEALAELANRQRVDFMISSDHGTLKPLEEGKEHWYRNTLFLVGEEQAVSEGYLILLNLSQMPVHPIESGTDWIRLVNEQNGLAFIAHPGHPSWKWNGEMPGGIVGMEILDFADQWYSASFLTLLNAVIIYPLDPTLALLSIYRRPDTSLNEWDRLTAGKRAVGIFAPDFHQAVRLFGDYKYPFPAAAAILPMAHDHILVRSELTGALADDRNRVYDAIRKGHLFVSLDAVADGTGFFFSATRGDTTWWMGDELPAGEETIFKVRLPPAYAERESEIRVWMNGRLLLSSPQKALEFHDRLPGAYRIEVLTGFPSVWSNHRQDVTLYSNPIYLR